MDPGELSFEELGAKLRDNFPNAGAITPARLLGFGFRSIAIETEEGWVFRIARNPFAYDGQQRELALLPRLARKLPIPTPEPKWYAGRCYDFPYGVIAYKKLPGVPLDLSTLPPEGQERAASGLGNFIAALHGFPLEGNGAYGAYLRTALANSGLLARAALALDALEGRVTPDEYRILAKWWDEFDSYMRHTVYVPVLRHGDLWYDNILVDPATGEITGIVDFEEAGIGDGAQDFATLLHSGYDFTARVLIAYRSAGGTIDNPFLRRLRQLWAAREFDSLVFAVETGDETELEDSIAKLRRGAILDPKRHDRGFAYLESVLEIS